MAGLSGSVIELSNYLEQRISQKSAEYAAVSIFSAAIFLSNLFYSSFGTKLAEIFIYLLCS